MPHPLVTQLRFTRSEWVRGLKAVTAEMDLSIIAFNLKRAIAALGAGELLRRLALA